MLKHIAVSGVFIALLVAALVYCISPGEVGMVWSAVRNRASQVELVVSETSNREAQAIDRMRQTPPAPSATSSLTAAALPKITPDPFRPFGPRRPSAANRFWVWLRGPGAVALWLSIAALALAGKYALRRRCQFAAQQRMALTLSKAVRQM